MSKLEYPERPKLLEETECQNCHKVGWIEDDGNMLWCMACGDVWREETAEPTETRDWVVKGEPKQEMEYAPIEEVMERFAEHLDWTDPRWLR